MAAWTVAVNELDGTRVAFLEPDSLAWTRRWCGGAELAFRVATLDPVAAELLIGQRVIDAYQDGVLRFRGRVHQPLIRTSDWVTVRAADAWFDLFSRRIVSSSFTSYTSQDAGAIAWSVIHNDDITTAPTRLVEGTIETSSNVAVDFELGTSYADAIQRLAELANFGFRVDPVATAGKLGSFNVFSPSSATDRPELRFEYGAGTLANLDDFQEEQLMPTNQVRVTGTPYADGTKPIETANSSPSIATYDRWDGELSVPDEGTDLPTLFARASAAVIADPPATWALTPGADAPILGRDFDAGDVGRILLRHGAVDVAGSALVAEATLAINNESGREQLASITLADPAIAAVARAARPEAYRIFSVMETYQRRLAMLERSPVTGTTTAPP